MHLSILFILTLAIEALAFCGTQNASESLIAYSQKKIKGLFLMLMFFGEAACTKIHDKVFSLLGLSEECCRKQLVVDYSVSPTELGKILFNHQISYHDSRGRLKEVAWRLRDTFLSLEPQPKQGNALRTQISFQVSLTLVDTTFVTVVCRPRGRIASLYGLDAMIGMMESVLPTVPDSTLMEEFLQHKSAHHTEKKVTPFITEDGYSCKAYGKLQIGDLVCELNDGELVVLRQERQQMRVVGFQPWDTAVFPRATTSEAVGPKHLFLDYPALLTFCKLFDYELSFNCYPQKIKEWKKREGEADEL
jgi:hypothetical protein